MRSKCLIWVASAALIAGCQSTAMPSGFEGLDYEFGDAATAAFWPAAPFEEVAVVDVNGRSLQISASARELPDGLMTSTLRIEDSTGTWTSESVLPDEAQEPAIRKLEVGDVRFVLLISSTGFARVILPEGEELLSPSGVSTIAGWPVTFVLVGEAGEYSCAIDDDRVPECRLGDAG